VALAMQAEDSDL